MKKVLIYSLLIIALVGLNACDNNPTVVEDNTYQLTIINDGTFTDNVDLCNVVDATIETDMQFNYGSASTNKMMMNPTPTNMMFPLAGILRQLNLTQEQVATIRGYVKDYYDCISRAQKILRATEEAILKRANEARREVMAKLKSGEITRTEAARQIANINQKAREALKNSEARKAALKQIQDCMSDYIAKIRLILDDSQLARFNELLKRLRSDLGSSTGTRE